MYRWLQVIWYGRHRVPLLLRALALLFAGLTALRRIAYQRGWRRGHDVGCPVIVVGNISVGGTGKTPLTIWLAQQLRKHGWRVGVVLRGYGGSQAGPMEVTADSDVAVVGDEARVLLARTGCPVAVGRDRVAAARLLVRGGAGIIIADDGLQHLRLRRAAELAVIDGERGFGNARLLPAGPLREPVTRLASVTAIVQNGGTTLWHADALRMQLRGDTLWPVAGQGATLPLDALAGRAVHAVAAIGNPQRFFALLQLRGLRVSPHALPDHQALRAADVGFGDDLPVLMTEKDAVKCRAFAGPRHWYLPVDATFEPADARRLLERIFMDSRLLDILVCPLCKGPLQFERTASELVCRADRLAFPVRDGIPVMLEEEARTLASDDAVLQR